MDYIRQLIVRGGLSNLLDEPGYKVKRIVVLPGQVSLQKHQHRAEHWTVVEERPGYTIAVRNLNSQFQKQHSSLKVLYID